MGKCMRGNTGNYSFRRDIRAAQPADNIYALLGAAVGIAMIPLLPELADFVARRFRRYL